ncbi:MAG: prephenate dehydrogenase/arogenate dehydrogenase family protein [Candidatus Caldarchaeum sp.]
MAKQVAAVVGAGPMGLWTARHLRGKQFTVKVYDKNPAKTRQAAKHGGLLPARSLDDAVSDASYVVVATGSLNAGETIKKIAASHSGKTVIDISSVKTPVLRSLRRENLGDNLVVLTHPLFGPGTTKLTDKTVVFTPFRYGERERRVAVSIFRPCRILAMTVEEHDLRMAYAMAVPRILMLVLLDSWRSMGVDVLTTSQKALTLAASTMLSDSPALIREVIAANPYTSRAIAAFRKNLDINKPQQVNSMLKRLKPQLDKLAQRYGVAYKWVEQRP